MKEYPAAILLAYLLFSVGGCKDKESRIERAIEDGVDVITNHLELYKVKGEASNLTLELSFVLDFENSKFANIGISDVAGFDIDSAGNIYIWTHTSSEYHIFKFDEHGHHVSSFGRRGQGPGEHDAVVHLSINEQNEILISNNYGRVMVLLDSDGNYIRQISLSSDYVFPAFLKNGNILIMKFLPINAEGIIECPIILCNEKFEEIALLHQGYKLPNWLRAKKINGLMTSGGNYPPWCISGGFIYIANQNNGYEFLVYDFMGVLQKKIRKEYTHVPVPEHVKKQVLKVFEENPLQKEYQIKDKVYFPDFMPPFQYFFVDKGGRLFVMTNEETAERKYKYNIFNSDGVFICETSLDNIGNVNSGLWGGPFEVRINNDCIYYLRAKENGYKELVVHRMIWE
jgi:hypothetical protein